VTSVQAILRVAVTFLVAALVASAQSAPPSQAESESPTKPQEENAPYQGITNGERLRWAIDETLGPAHLMAGLFTAGIGTARDAPHEYGGSWSGFGQRFGIREAGVSLSNAMEAGLGDLWGEDPRYFRVPEQKWRGRIVSVVKQTFVARHRNGQFGPAYARYIAFSGNNFISNAWRAGSEADTQHALSRTSWAFAGRMASNAYDEFWPDVKRKLFHHDNH
jgi:hypothetical protein